MEPTLTVGNIIYKHGQQIKFQGLNGFQKQLQGKMIDLNDKIVTGLNPKYPATLEYSKGNWMTKPEWFIRTSTNKFGLNSVNVLNDHPYVEGKYNIQFEDLDKEANQLKEAKESKQRKAIEEQQRIAKEDQEAETNYTPIPCSQTPINLKDRVMYNGKEGVVTGFEITFGDQTKQMVPCDEKLFSITAGIEKNKSDLFTKRNPGVVYAHVVAGSRKRKIKRKTRYGKR
jgi:hypothetical protein